MVFYIFNLTYIFQVFPSAFSFAFSLLSSSCFTLKGRSTFFILFYCLVSLELPLLIPTITRAFFQPLGRRSCCHHLDFSQCLSSSSTLIPQSRLVCLPVTILPFLQSPSFEQQPHLCAKPQCSACTFQRDIPPPPPIILHHMQCMRSYKKGCMIKCRTPGN